MDIILANTAGFCFGVNNAIKIAEDMQDDEIVICTLGLLIHNEQVVNSLKEKGDQGHIRHKQRPLKVRG